MSFDTHTKFCGLIQVAVENCRLIAASLNDAKWIISCLGPCIVQNCQRIPIKMKCPVFLLKGSPVTKKQQNKQIKQNKNKNGKLKKTKENKICLVDGLRTLKQAACTNLNFLWTPSIKAVAFLRHKL